MRHATFGWFLTLALLSGCHHGKAATPDAPRPEPPVALRAVGEDQFLLADNANVFADSTRKVVKDTIEWKSLWQRATSRQPSPPPRPTVDFSKDMVVLAAAGRMKPGDVIHVDSVGTRGDLTVIVIRTTVGCQSFASDAFPFEIARVPRSNGRIQFREHRLRAPECQ
jgi:hypothetical protein